MRIQVTRYFVAALLVLLIAGFTSSHADPLEDVIYKTVTVKDDGGGEGQVDLWDSLGSAISLDPQGPTIALFGTSGGASSILVNGDDPHPFILINSDDPGSEFAFLIGDQEALPDPVYIFTVTWDGDVTLPKLGSAIRVHPAGDLSMGSYTSPGAP